MLTTYDLVLKHQRFVFYVILCSLTPLGKHNIWGFNEDDGANQRSILVRTMVENKASKNALLQFYLLGYELYHELLWGFGYHFQNGAQITIMVSSYSKMLNLHATEFIDNNVVVTPSIQMIEVTAPASTEITLKLLQQFLYFVNILQYFDSSSNFLSCATTFDRFYISLCMG
ncbi:putative mediator complex, subunit Med18 [Helianthus anomalus]